jgi:hypothetical protein
MRFEKLTSKVIEFFAPDKCYDPNLKYKLPANNDGNDIVLNNNFKEWDEVISKNLKKRKATCGIKYRKGKDKELLELCQKHAKEYQQSTNGKNTIMFTHPFYLHLSHMDEIRSDNVREEADAYLDNLLKLLHLNRDKSKVNIVALETIHHYAAATSLLLEEGLIDSVIFTEYDYGCPLNTNELKKFRRNYVFFGGGYNGQCLASSINEMKEKSFSKQIWAIKEFVINSPQHYRETLKRSSVEGIKSSKIIKLEEVIKMLDLGK